MGVPGFCSWIENSFPNITNEITPDGTYADVVAVDMNGLLHTQLRRATDQVHQGRHISPFDPPLSPIPHTAPGARDRTHHEATREDPSLRAPAFDGAARAGWSRTARKVGDAATASAQGGQGVDVSRHGEAICSSRDARHGLYAEGGECADLPCLQ
jgi:hypothetical protein